MRRFCYRLHLWLGISVGLWFTAAGLTGSVLLFKPELESWNARLRPALSGGNPANCDALLALVHRTVPNASVRYIFPAATADVPWQFELRDGKRVLIDAGNEAVLATIDPAATVVGRIRHWHTEMFAGRIGAKATGFLGLASLTLCVTGMVVWLPSKPLSFLKRKRAAVATRRNIWSRLHRAVGLAALPMLLLIAFTGTTLAWGDWSTRFAQWLSGTKPTPAPIAKPADSALPLQQLLSIADQMMPNARTTRIALPATPDTALVVRKKTKDESHPNGMNFIHLDPHVGTVLHVRRANEQRWPMRLLDLRYPLHIGSYGGNWLRFVHLLAGLSPLVLAVSGIVLTLRRRIGTRGAAVSKRPAAAGETDCDPRIF